MAKKEIDALNATQSGSFFPSSANPHFVLLELDQLLLPRLYAARSSHAHGLIVRALNGLLGIPSIMSFT